MKKLKHAYLIIAHDNFYILEKLLKLIDHSDNDIYIHVDSKIKDFDFSYVTQLLKHSSIYFTERIPVYWGHYSQINAELILLKAAFQREYSYYHLLSGVDLPIKTQSYIYNYFEGNGRKEYLEIVDQEEVIKNKIIEDRVKYYKFFVKYYRSKSKIKSKFFRGLDKGLVLFQRIIGVSRLEKDIHYKKGANWFSITNEIVKYVVENEKWIHKNFKYTYCADEIFLQTLIYNADKNFKLNVDIMREIDWKRGTPYIYTIDDRDTLLASKKLFARKFSANVDINIIDEIYNEVDKSK